ncbi:hypothetical protein DFN06_004681 [Clostridium beijerinckii]|nr:hypothetical protein [Clostridium beijerinckii]NYB95263.1 hypothetical protein [Clostridium beijerinckii]OOM22537.1 hypothetical protein CLBEI_31880 [Clostridium beijerinckii]SQB00407.1 Uncharacterised protein [Clostridium beijerinckii]
MISNINNKTTVNRMYSSNMSTYKKMTIDFLFQIN